jgi:hypothetical protein
MSEYLGKTIGEFQLVETVDESGSAMVFKGFQPAMNRYVAVKVLKPSTAPLSLLFLLVLMIVLNFSDVIGLLGSGGLLASLVLVVLTTAGGYLLGKLGAADDWIQGLGAGQRNIAAAMVVATMNFGNDEIVMVVVYSLIGMVVIIPLALELGKRAAK